MCVGCRCRFLISLRVCFFVCTHAIRFHYRAWLIMKSLCGSIGPSAHLFLLFQYILTYKKKKLNSTESLFHYFYNAILPSPPPLAPHAPHIVHSEFEIWCVSNKLRRIILFFFFGLSWTINVQCNVRFNIERLLVRKVLNGDDWNLIYSCVIILSDSLEVR